MSDKSKTRFKKNRNGQIQCPSGEKRPGRLLEKGEVLSLLARNIETRGRACRGGWECHQAGRGADRRGCG